MGTFGGQLIQAGGSGAGGVIKDVSQGDTDARLCSHELGTWLGSGQ